ncbi:hypothetical protein STXM2123_4123 [Streptomyces sp. F-3]|nr:hypothetical protein STXM2123_4123 [Streptomyces sp. F-3]
MIGFTPLITGAARGRARAGGTGPGTADGPSAVGGFPHGPRVSVTPARHAGPG